MFLIISRQIQQFSKRYRCDRLIVTGTVGLGGMKPLPLGWGGNSPSRAAS